MFSKISNRTLIILMVILGAAVVWTYFNETKQGESNYREQLVEIDTADVSQIFIYPKSAPGEEIKIFRTAGGWRVSNGKEEAPVDPQTVNTLFSSFANLKARSLAATSKDQWENFMVGDTSANRIKFVTHSKTADIMVGKISFNNETRSPFTYVRLKNETEVYLTDGFLSFTINQPFNSWRNHAVLRKGEQQWNRITFSYPADTGFAITRDSTTWFLGTDTAFAAERFINEISYLNGDNFASKPVLPNTPLFRISIDGLNMTSLTIDFFQANEEDKYYVKSSLNPETVFSDKEGVLAAKLLKPSVYFTSKP